MVLTKKLCLVFLWLLTLGGCSSTTGSGASAPPVSLPAPVTGRLTVTSPDSDSGAALITGDQGAVSGGAVVHAVNESQGGTSALRFLSSLFPSAQAQAALPEICSRTFHACVVAQADGSFEMEVAASIGDQIGVEVIDQTTGTAISPRDRHPVPQNVRRFIRGVVDVDMIPSTNQLFALVHGDVSAAIPGLVTIVDLNTNTRNPITFDGFNPNRLVLHPATNLAAVTDLNGGLVDFVDLTTNQFGAPIRKVSIPASTTVVPTDVVFNTAGDLAIASYRSDEVGIAVINPLTGVITDFFGNDDLLGSGFDTNHRVGAVDITNISSVPTDIFAFVGSFMAGSTETPIMTLGRLSAGGSISPISLPILLEPGTTPQDVAFYTIGANLRVLITDNANDRIWIYNIALNFGALPPINIATTTLLGSIATDAGGNLINPDRIVIDSVDQMAYITAHNATDLHPAQVLTVDLQTQSLVDVNPVGHNPTGIAWDPVHQTVFVSTLGTHSVTSWGLADLLP